MNAEAAPQSACACFGTDVVLLACSGASNVGHLSDLAARELTRRGAARMGCLAGVGGRSPGTLNTLRQARRIVVLDGCGSECGRHALTDAGFEGFVHLRVDKMGMKRGETPVTEENVRRLADAVCRQIAESPASPGNKVTTP